MGNATKPLQPAHLFAHEHNVPLEQVLAWIREGTCVGQFIADTWYVDSSSNIARRWDTSLGILNRSTAIMLAAANLDTDQLTVHFRKREEYPFRADTPEHGIDIDLIYAELSRAKNRLLVRDLILLVLGIGLIIIQFAIAPTDDDQQNLIRGGILLAMAIVIFIHLQIARMRVRAIFLQTSNDDAPRSGIADPALIVSGGYSPFVGSGWEINGWSFTVNLAKPGDESRSVKPVTTSDLYRETDEAINKLEIPGLQRMDEVFVDGRDMKLLPNLFNPLFPEKPRCFLSLEEMGDLRDNANKLLRHYRAFRMELWSGQLILSVFLKYIKLVDTLYVETRFFLIPPLKENLSKHECTPLKPLVRDINRDIVYSLILAPFVWLKLILFTAVKFSNGTIFSNPARKNRREMRRNRKYNFGWEASLRESFASTDYERYFQMIDNDFYNKMIKEALLDSLVSSLEERNVCTDTLTETQTKIFNEGIILTGGSLKTRNLSVGRGAKASFFSGKEKMRKRESETLRRAA
jgi:hypothetical protein